MIRAHEEIVRKLLASSGVKDLDYTPEEFEELKEMHRLADKHNIKLQPKERQINKR